MSESDERPPAPPRFPPAGGFPHAAALLCAACLGAAGWTWMRYSYAWDVDYGADGLDRLSLTGRGAIDRFVAFRADSGCVEGRWFEIEEDPPMTYAEIVGDEPMRSGRRATAIVWEVTLRAQARPSGRKETLFITLPVQRRISLASLVNSGVTGRVCVKARLSNAEDQTNRPLIDTTASRFHGASIAGLAVGGMGILVFALTFRHWLRCRRAAREDRLLTGERYR